MFDLVVKAGQTTHAHRDGLEREETHPHQHLTLITKVGTASLLNLHIHTYKVNLTALFNCLLTWQFSIKWDYFQKKMILIWKQKLDMYLQCTHVYHLYSYLYKFKENGCPEKLLSKKVYI